MAETPCASEIEDELRKVIVWATLENKYFRLVGSDLAGEVSIVAGNNVSILVQCNSINERERFIRKLENKTRAGMHNDALVNVVDMYRVNWIFSVNC